MKSCMTDDATLDWAESLSVVSHQTFAYLSNVSMSFVGTFPFCQCNHVLLVPDDRLFAAGQGENGSRTVSPQNFHSPQGHGWKVCVGVYFSSWTPSLLCV